MHKIFIWSMTLVVVFTTIYLGYFGYNYYTTPLEDRFYHPQHEWFKASGLFGQGLGVIGTFLILFGVVLYIVAKKYGIFDRFIRLKYILEFHIFLCTLGPILILFHTTFKFGGIVSVAFWSMVAVVLSGVIGRYLYLQIPRSAEGRELSLEGVAKTQEDLIHQLQHLNLKAEQVAEIATNKNLYYKLGPKAMLKRFFYLKKQGRQWQSEGLQNQEIKTLKKLINQQWKMRRKLDHMGQMQKIFSYWHVAHKPFALIMLVIVVIHVSLTVSFGYTWIW